MTILLFLLFVWASIFALMQIYRFSTYHKDFPKMLPALLGYGVLVGYLLFVFSFSQYFIYYVVLATIFLTVNYRKQKEASKAMLSPAENEDEKQKKLIEESGKNTMKFHLLSSVVYIVTVIVSFLYFYN